LAQPPPVSHRTKGGDPGVGYTWVRSMGLGKSPRVLWDQELGRPAQDSREITITPFWPPALDPDRVLHHNVHVAPSPKTLKSSQVLEGFGRRTGVYGVHFDPFWPFVDLFLGTSIGTPDSPQTV